jgi:diguanylate cyclase (GGDEF)-like protein
VSAPDVLWVLGYPLLAAGMVLLVRLRAPGRLREAALDVLAMATVVAALFWQFMVAPEVTGNTMSLAVLFSVFYPFGDVLLFAAGALVVLSPGERTASTRYLIAALAVTFAGDVTISVVSPVFPDFDTARLDSVLLLANGLLTAAIRHRDPEPASAAKADAQRLHPARVVFLGVSLLALPSINDMRIDDQAIQRFTMLSAMVMLTVIVLIRFTLVVREQERVRAALAHRATHDQLTGLVNRQELHVRLTAALRQRTGDGPVVHFLDLNGFKPVNDRYGHAAGDFVLTEVARRLRATVRDTDTVARLGGDEFVVVSAAVDDIAAVTARLRDAVAAPLHYDGHDLRIGVSVGHASAADLEHPTSDTLLAAADATMYREKGATYAPDATIGMSRTY